MKNNDFLIIVPVYQSVNWITLCIEMIKIQTGDFECIIIDDASTDGTQQAITKAIENDSRFTFYTNKENVGSSLHNFFKVFDMSKVEDEKIVVWMDGDDWFTSPFVLKHVSSEYDRTGCWMTYGTYQVYPSAKIAHNHCIECTPEMIENFKGFRDMPFIFSHLRTHKAFLLRALNRKDLIDERTGNIFTEATDCAYLLPLVEMCGNEHFHRIQYPVYMLNRTNPISIGNIRMAKQKETERIIRNKKPYEALIR